MCADEQVLGAGRRSATSSPIAVSAMPAVPRDLLPERHVVAAHAQDVHGAEVQDLRQQDSDYGAGVHQRFRLRRELSAVTAPRAASPIGFSAGRGVASAPGRTP